jgi:type I restriction enzyme R subunit
VLKVVMTGSAADPALWQPHIRNKTRREALANRFRDAADPFRVVIVRDMWLTGFDAPSLHTMYVDKPMRGHGLMQAIARVNRVFKDKPGGLVVDYLGLADELKQALATYTESGGTGRTAIDQHEAVAVMLEKYEVCSGLFHGFDWSVWAAGTVQQRLSLLAAAQDHVLGLERGKERLSQAANQLAEAFALAVPDAEALRIRDDVGFFQAVRAVLAKNAPGERRPDEELDQAIRQIVSKALVTDQVVDIFAAAGLRKPDISILSDEFLAEIRGMPQRNLAVELLRKLLAGDIKTRSRRNVVQARSFAELLEQPIRKYQNRAIETAQVIEELIGLAQDMRAASARGEHSGCRRTSWRSTTRSKPMTARSRCWVSRPCWRSPGSWSRPCARTSRSTGPYAKTCARKSASSSGGSCGNTVIRPTSRRRRRRRCSSRPRSCRRDGPQPEPYRRSRPPALSVVDANPAPA